MEEERGLLVWTDGWLTFRRVQFVTLQHNALAGEPCYRVTKKESQKKSCNVLSKFTILC